MTRLVTILALAAVMLLGSTLPALASTESSLSPVPAVSAEPEKKLPQLLERIPVIKGKVEAVDVTAGTLTVDGKVIYVDSETKINIPAARILRPEVSNIEPQTSNLPPQSLRNRLEAVRPVEVMPPFKNATLADIKVGMEVVASLKTKDGKLYARHINVIPGLSPIDIRHYTGKVVKYAYAAATGGGISIENKEGTLSFVIKAGEFKILPAGVEVKEGDMVTVIGQRNTGSGPLVATGVVVHPQQNKPQTYRGVVSAIDKTAKTITIGDKTFSYNEKTLFVLHGLVSVEVGHEAIVAYVEQAGGTLLAKRVLVGIDLPETMRRLAE